jgi:hypothetical protein
MEEGYLYCISNLDVMPDIFKVGVTMRSPLDRLKEANSSETWKIPTYKVEFAKKVMNPKDKEKRLHKLMEKFMKRVHPRREFFKGKIEDIREVFDLLDGEMWTDKPVIQQTEYPINLEDRLSEDGDIRVRQLKEIIKEVFKDCRVDFVESGITNNNNHYLVNINDNTLLVLENHNNGMGKIALFSTPYNRNNLTKSNHVLSQYYKELDWEQFGIGASRKQYDTEGKTKIEVNSQLEKLRSAYMNYNINVSEKVVDSVVSDVIKDEKDIIWSDDINSRELTDKFGNSYGFSDSWKRSPYIKTITKNGELFKKNGGVHRGYSIWLDYDNVIHISRGSVTANNAIIYCHCIFDDNTLTDDWLCNWIKMSKDEIQYIHNHFEILNI